jgi:uncharacterized iron-regulated membrane protein
MVAVHVVPSSSPSCPSRGPAAPAPSTGPDLRLIQGGRRPVRATHPLPAGVYRRRRLLAAGVALVILAVVGLAVVGAHSMTSADARTGSPAVASSPGVGSATPPTAAGAESYLVRSGDTLWGIAHTLKPEGDLRPLVDALAERASGAGLQPGQRIDLRGLVD